MLNRLPLRIHCWGGLGSQLYAWALYEKILAKKPKKNIKIVLHTSGVTRRTSELNSIFGCRQLVIVDDFKSSAPETNLDLTRENKLVFQSLFAKLHSITIRLIKRSLFFSHLISDCETDSGVNRIRPWTISIRGHYSKLQITSEIFQRMYKRAVDVDFVFLKVNSNLKHQLAIHYRLGDLLTLSSKSYLDPIRISHCLANLKNDYAVVLSDSPAVAIEFISRNTKDMNFHYRDLDTWETVRLLISTDIFIGTPSKISEWVSLIRLYFGDMKGIIYLPYEMQPQMNRIIVDPINCSKINYY